MSDYITEIGKIKIEQHLTVDGELSKVCVGNLAVKSKSKIAYTLNITRKYLHNLHDLKTKFQLSLITLFNDSLPRGILPIQENCQRVEKT